MRSTGLSNKYLASLLCNFHKLNPTSRLRFTERCHLLAGVLIKSWLGGTKIKQSWLFYSVLKHKIRGIFLCSQVRPCWYKHKLTVTKQYQCNGGGLLCSEQPCSSSRCEGRAALPSGRGETSWCKIKLSDCQDN